MEVARHWREIPKRYRMEAHKCKKCKHISFPGRIICPVCGDREFDTFNLKGDGTIVSYTIIRTAPSGFLDLAPYVVGIIELEEGIKVMGQITDCEPEKLNVGDKVIAKFRRMNEEGKTGMIIYSFKFVPDVGV